MRSPAREVVAPINRISIQAGRSSMNQANNASEPPSCLHPPIFMIGRDSRGNWVAKDQSGARGGLFVDRSAALKFARDEGGGHPRAIVWVSGPLELGNSGAPIAMPQQQLADSLNRGRRVA
jgi:hypothetical protein